MKLLLAFLTSLLLLMSGASFASVAVAEDSEGTTITLEDSACVSVKAQAELPRFNALSKSAGLPEQTIESFKAARVVFKGKVYEACWTIVGMQVVVMDDGGSEESIFAVPIPAFHVPQPI